MRKEGKPKRGGGGGEEKKFINRQDNLIKGRETRRSIQHGRLFIVETIKKLPPVLNPHNREYRMLSLRRSAAFVFLSTQPLFRHGVILFEIINQCSLCSILYHYCLFH